MLAGHGAVSSAGQINPNTLAAGRYRKTGTWRIYSEHKAKKQRTSIGYIAQALLKTGEIRVMPSSHILEIARELSLNITEADLEPEDESTK